MATTAGGALVVGVWLSKVSPVILVIIGAVIVVLGVLRLFRVLPTRNLSPGIATIGGIVAIVVGALLIVYALVWR